MTNANPSQTKQFQDEFKLTISEYLSPNHYQGTTLLRFIGHQAQKWKLQHVEPLEILIEAMRRGIDCIQRTGQPIRNPAAWLRKTSVHLLCDEVKKASRQEDYDEQDGTQCQNPKNPLLEAELSEQLEKLQEAFQELSEEERFIINLRFQEGRTYEQIQKHYETRDNQLMALSTLRKKESRALNKLKNIFFRVYQI